MSFCLKVSKKLIFFNFFPEFWIKSELVTRASQLFCQKTQSKWYSCFSFPKFFDTKWKFREKYIQWYIKFVAYNTFTCVFLWFSLKKAVHENWCRKSANTEAENLRGNLFVYLLLKINFDASKMA